MALTPMGFDEGIKINNIFETVSSTTPLTINFPNYYRGILYSMPTYANRAFIVSVVVNSQGSVTCIPMVLPDDTIVTFDASQKNKLTITTTSGSGVYIADLSSLGVPTV